MARFRHSGCGRDRSSARDIQPPHIPGHEFAGVIEETGKAVTNWKIGDRVTAPFVCGCGECRFCKAGDQQVCPHQFQPGFTAWGSFAGYLMLEHAEENLVGLPEELAFSTGASLGCRLSTAYRAVVNQAPELFLGMVIQVGFLDSLTTNLDHSLPLSLGELTEFSDAKGNAVHFKYIKSYSPYHNIKKMDYPNLLLVTNLKDVRVIFDEPTKFTAKLRQYKTDDNLLLLKCELEDAGHGGKSGRDSAIEEIAFDYSFILKITKKLNI